MKKLFILLVLLCSVAVSNAQEKETENRSKAALFEESKGSLIRKDFYNLPKVGGLENNVLILTDIFTGTKIGCLRMEYYDDYNDLRAGYIDFEELDAAIKSLSYIKETILHTTPDVYTEFSFKSKDGVQLGTYFNEKTQKWVVFIWLRKWADFPVEVNAEPKCSSRKYALHCDVTQLSKMIENLKRAKSKIQELTK
ncbi:MAG: hypothetical protein SO293_04290 [Alloprevotella sp.]|nr:hypothetical protein [Alloprevotella sp.]